MQRTGRIALLGLLALVGLGLWLEHVELLLHKKYAIDEFQYAHGAWLIAHGQVIYRDFFEHHFPLIHQLLSLAFRVLGDDPTDLIVLRVLMLPFFTLTALLAWRLNRVRCGVWAAATAVVLLATPTYAFMATEIRPDPLAAMLFTAALAAHTWTRASPRTRGLVSGLCFALAVWGTQKALYYGLVFVAALAVDLAARRRRGGPYLLSDPLAFLAGAGAVAAVIAAYLTLTGSWAAWLEWTIRWSFVHQWHYPGFPWSRNFMMLVDQSLWLFPFAVVGVVSTVRNRPEPLDWLLLGSLVTTLASFAWQSAAYLYSLIPFTVMLAVFAARGVVAALRYLWSRGHTGVFAVVLLALVLGVEAQRAHTALRKLAADTNDAQNAVLADLGRRTRPDEPVLHIAGGQIARPSVHFFYFMEAVVRQLEYDVFARELPKAMVERGCIAFMPDERFQRMPEPLRRFLLANYQPATRDLWFYGRRWTMPEDGLMEDVFPAIRSGRYFVWPSSARGGLTLDGRSLADTVVELAAGPHPFRYQGDADELFLLWLPADGQPFEPRPELQPPLVPGELEP